MAMGIPSRARGLLLAALLLGAQACLACDAAAQDVAAITQAAPPVESALSGIAIDPAWPKHIYILADSVVLGAKDTIIKGLPDWKVTFEGRPALMIHVATKELRQRHSALPPVAIIALGYNSLWERDRKSFGHWSKRFDHNVEDMLAALRERGVKKVVWVMLRELTPDLIPKGHEAEYKRSWYFPYVNERLRDLQQANRDLALADWRSASNRLGLTYDFIHVNTSGARVMLQVLKVAMGI